MQAGEIHSFLAWGVGDWSYGAPFYYLLLSESDRLGMTLRFYLEYSAFFESTENERVDRVRGRGEEEEGGRIEYKWEREKGKFARDAPRRE